MRLQPWSTSTSTSASEMGRAALLACVAVAGGCTASGTAVTLTIEGPSGIEQLLVTARYDALPRVLPRAVSPAKPVSERVLAILPDEPLTVTFEVKGLAGTEVVAHKISPPIMVPARSIVAASITLEPLGGPGDPDGGASSNDGSVNDMGAWPDAGDGVAFVQQAGNKVSGSSVSATFPSPQRSGDLNVVVVGGATSAFTSVTDTSNNQYLVAVPLTTRSFSGQTLFYAPLIKAAASNTVTATYDGSTALSIEILEYAGVSQLDKTASKTGSSASGSVGPLEITAPNQILVAAGCPAGATFAEFKTPGNGFVARVFADFGRIVEDRIAPPLGNHDATAGLDQSGGWIMQAATFR